MEKNIFRLAYDVHMEVGSSDTAEVMLYGEIVEDGPRWWKWSQEDKSAADFDKAIKEAKEKGAKKILLRINSPGGICSEAAAMRSTLANAGFEEINIRIEGMCASAATFVATLPTAHSEITEGSMYMIHNPRCGAWGEASELEHTAAMLRSMEQMYQSAYAKRTGQDEGTIKAWMDEEKWFTPEQAVQYGFVDEITGQKAGTTPAVACVTRQEMDTMRALYRSVPEQVKAQKPEPPVPENNGSNGSPSGGEPAEINENEEGTEMNIKDMNLDQLSAENPELLRQIQDNAIAAERQRQEDIDALTMPGYETMAAEAKANGTSAVDFQKQVVAAMKKKGADFIAGRRNETAPAVTVSGGAPQTPAEDEEKEIQSFAKDIAAYAAAYAGGSDAGMY